jgi:3-deoxy-D-manno-oct-2-ulosonic acid (Kdo) hydroxylase
MLERLHITKGKRSLYDHFMLCIHDAMKADERYQAQVQQAEIAFPAGATWACFTDAVSHAAMSGQHAFEQTFSLPVKAMQDPSLAPVRVLERELGRPLI